MHTQLHGSLSVHTEVHTAAQNHCQSKYRSVQTHRLTIAFYSWKYIFWSQNSFFRTSLHVWHVVSSQMLCPLQVKKNGRISDFVLMKLDWWTEKNERNHISGRTKQREKPEIVEQKQYNVYFPIIICQYGYKYYLIWESYLLLNYCAMWTENKLLKFLREDYQILKLQ